MASSSNFTSPPTQPPPLSVVDRPTRHGAGAPPDAGLLLPGLVIVALGVGLATLLSTILPLSTLVVAVFVGAVVGNSGLANATTRPGLTFAAKRFLRVGVVLLGFRLSFGEVAELGAAGIGVVAVTVTATFFGTKAVGRRLGLSPDLSLLVATGYSICGASAIAAVEGSTDADEEEVAAAIGLVTLFGSLAIVAIPVLAGPLGLDDAQFGAWAGASVHDVAQVAATASIGGTSVVGIAMVVKLTRVMLLAPIVVGVNVQRSRVAPGGHGDADNRGAARRSTAPMLPLFVAGFLITMAIRSTGMAPDPVVVGAGNVEGVLFAAALIGLGAGVRVDGLRRLGPRPLLLGTIAWALVATASYLGIVLFI